jgi:hypothetical protein
LQVPQNALLLCVMLALSCYQIAVIAPEPAVAEKGLRPLKCVPRWLQQHAALANLCCAVLRALSAQHAVSVAACAAARFQEAEAYQQGPQQ